MSKEQPSAVPPFPRPPPPFPFLPVIPAPPSRHSRERGNPGNPLPSAGGDARAQRCAGEENAPPANQRLILPRHSRAPPSFPPPTVIPANAGIQETPSRLWNGTRKRSEARGRRTPPARQPTPHLAPSFPFLPVIPGPHRHCRTPPSFPRTRESRKPPPVCGRGRASAAKRGGGERPARQPTPRLPPPFPFLPVIPAPHRHSRERGNPGNPLPSAGGDARAQRCAGEENASPANQRLVFPRHSRSFPSFPRPTVIPANAGS